MKIYTKTGDDGTTGLLGGQRVSKSDLRIECIGAMDELNACIGHAAVGAANPRLREIQNELFLIGSHIATPAERAATSKLPELNQSSIQRLEHEIDAAEAELPVLRQFILPGGCELAGRLHFARAVCRRAERLLVALSAHAPVDKPILEYVNRLSDWIFVMARLANYRAGCAEIQWKIA